MHSALVYIRAAGARMQRSWWYAYVTCRGQPSSLSAAISYATTVWKMPAAICFSWFRRNRVAPAEKLGQRLYQDITGWAEPALKDCKKKNTGSKPHNDAQSQEKDLPNFTRRFVGPFVLCSVPGGPDDRECSQRPLVIIIPWLRASQRHVTKYTHLYLKKGLDVLEVQVTPGQIIRPLKTKKIVRELLCLLQDEKGPFAKRPLILHGFSIGAFVWGQMMLEMSPEIVNVISDAHDDKVASETNRGPQPSSPAVSCSNGVENNGAKQAATSRAAGRTRKAKASASQQRREVDPGNPGDPSYDRSTTRRAGVAGVKAGPKRVARSSGGAGDDGAGCHLADESDTPGLNEKSTTAAGANLFADVQSRILGVIFDSPTPVETMLVGVPNSVTNSPIFRALLRMLLAAYIRAFPSSVGIHYIQGARAAERNVAGFPVLMLYSSADFVAPAEKLDTVITFWLSKGFFVRVKKWEHSPHVGHFRFYPEEYKEEVYAFLNSILTPKAKL